MSGSDLSSSQSQKKKEKERLVIEQFRRVYSEFPKGKIVPSESPDFILRSSTKYSIGIELVCLPMGFDSGNSTLQGLVRFLHLKEGKLALYRKRRLDLFWLLIYTENPGQVTARDLNKIRNTEFHSAYHKVFLYSIPENVMIILI